MANETIHTYGSGIHARTYKTVTRYVITHVTRSGMRQMTFAAQGRNTHETQEQAEERMRLVLGANSAATIARIYGDDPCFEVRAVECYAGHFDPVNSVFSFTLAQ